MLSLYSVVFGSFERKVFTSESCNDFQGVQTFFGSFGNPRSAHLPCFPKVPTRDIRHRNLFFKLPMSYAVLVLGVWSHPGAQLTDLVRLKDPFVRVIDGSECKIWNCLPREERRRICCRFDCQHQFEEGVFQNEFLTIDKNHGPVSWKEIFWVLNDCRLKCDPEENWIGRRKIISSWVELLDPSCWCWPLDKRLGRNRWIAMISTCWNLNGKKYRHLGDEWFWYRDLNGFSEDFFSCWRRFSPAFRTTSLSVPPSIYLLSWKSINWLETLLS